MSVNKNGVKFEKASTFKKKTAYFFLLALLEVLFSFFLYLSLAGRIFEPPLTQSAAGVPQLLSYQGRLTDSSGNPLGGAGTVYCFRYSIYDAASNGSKVWPSGTPTNSTTTVTDGVFNDLIGRVDTLTYDFFSTSTLYLNVEVNNTTSTCGGAWESLLPRQQIVSSGFSLTSKNIYGDAIRTITSTKVQIGTGVGVASNQTLLSLDVRNTAETIGTSCLDNGALWYNSNNTKALLCENGVITQISNPTSTISGIGVNSSIVSDGTVVFSNSNNVTFGLVGSTVTASITAAGGGGGATLSNFQPQQGIPELTVAYSNATMHIVPFSLLQNLTATRAALMGSHSIGTNTSGTTTGTWSFSVGIYTRNVSTLSLVSSGSQTFAISNTSNGSTSVYVGPRRFTVPININATPGDYWYAIWVRSSGNAQSLSLAFMSQISNQISGNFGVASNSSRQIMPGLGVFSNASFTTAMPASVAISNIKGGTAAGTTRIPWILFSNFDIQ